jgi:hypothetical protein
MPSAQVAVTVVARHGHCSALLSRKIVTSCDAVHMIDDSGVDSTV